MPVNTSDIGGGMLSRHYGSMHCVLISWLLIILYFGLSNFEV